MERQNERVYNRVRQGTAAIGVYNKSTLVVEVIVPVDRQVCQLDGAGGVFTNSTLAIQVIGPVYCQVCQVNKQEGCIPSQFSHLRPPTLRTIKSAKSTPQ